jgi:hypothetical protein
MTTVAELTAELALWVAARNAILAGAQSYSINGRSLSRASLETIRDEIAALQSRIDAKNAGGRCRSPLFPSLRG